MTRGFSVDRLVERVRARQPRRVWRLSPVRVRRAAVAVIFDAAGNVLLTRRASRAGDRWSAHVSLPGGMQHADDASLDDTARRETREEVSVDLAADADFIGALDEARATAHGGLRPMSISPFVFVAKKPLSPSTSAEVTRAFWFPLARAAAGDLDGSLTWPLFGGRWGVRVRWSSWDYDGETVWGLTYGILTRVIELGGDLGRTS